MYEILKKKTVFKINFPFGHFYTKNIKYYPQKFLFTPNIIKYLCKYKEKMKSNNIW